jgi:serine/threonine-protein kinase
MEFVQGTVVAGRFRLVHELGHGGMGAVWLAQDMSLDTPCAIKFIHGEAAESPELRARFEREAKSAAQLRSPNVVQILDHGISDGTPYIAMELLEGEDLEHRLRRVGRLSPYETVYILAQVGKALTRANAVGLVHRDLKPANIFLVRDEDRYIPKVLDFGVAKSGAPEVKNVSTTTGALMGTPYYMSPEQARGTRTLDHRSDLWALAVIAFQCLTGRLPFMSNSLGDVLFKIAADPLPVPTQVAPDLPASFDAWWARAAQRDPNQRFQTARELVDALAAAFGFSQGAVVPQAAPGSGQGVSTTAASRSWGDSESGRVSGAPSAGSGASAAATGPSMQTGVTTRSIAQPPATRPGRGVLVGIVGIVGSAVAVAGGLVYVLALRRSAAPAAPVAAASGTPAPMVSEAPQPVAEPPPSAPPSTSAAVSAPPLVDAGATSKPTNTPPSPAAGVKLRPPARPSPKPIPDDGI